MLLEGVRDFRVVAEAGDVEEARRCVRAHSPNVLVLDLDLPAGPTAAAISLIGEASPQTRIVLMSASEDPAFVREAIAAGALGYVPSTATAGELTTAVRRAASATARLAPGLAAIAASRPAPTGPRELSPREVEVIGLIALGYTNTEIGARLALSIRTIETHRAHIRLKLERPTRAELVQYAFEHGMGQPSA